MVATGPGPMDIDKDPSSSSSSSLLSHNIKDTPMTNIHNHNTSEETKQHLSEEEEARQAIEKLRGDDVSARVEAAYKLETVAKTLGEQRTRDVSKNKKKGIHFNLLFVSSHLNII